MSLTYRHGYFPGATVPYAKELAAAAGMTGIGALIETDINALVPIYWLSKSFALDSDLSYTFSATLTTGGSVPAGTYSATGTIKTASTSEITSGLLMNAPATRAAPLYYGIPWQSTDPSNMADFLQDCGDVDPIDSGTCSQPTGYPSGAYSIDAYFNGFYFFWLNSLAYFGGNGTFPVALDATTSKYYTRFSFFYFPSVVAGSPLYIGVQPLAGWTISAATILVQFQGATIATIPIYYYFDPAYTSTSATITGTITLNCNTLWTP